MAVVHDAMSILGAKFLPHIETRAASFGVQISRVAIHNAKDIEAGIDAFAAESGGGLIVLAGALTVTHRHLISSQALRHRLPAVYPYRAFALSGGLASYGVDIHDMYRRAASYVDRIFKGERPADLPVQFATKFEFVVNLKAAQAIGLSLPTSVLLRTSETIE